ncbi:MAG TPA: glycoside hydrolase family 27 protein [Bryobacteraceae bacterium]|nr:glycoside hydrolase family 27 protein [Bryobacteraceae bacterium]
MRWLYFAASALLPLAAHAQNVTGKWTGSASRYDNGIEITVALEQAAGGSITGYVEGPRSNDRITSGKLENGKLTLEAERAGRGGQMMHVTYTAEISGTKMTLTMPQMTFGGRAGGRGQQAPPRPPQVFELSRVSSKFPGPPPEPAPRVSLPMPEPVRTELARTPPMGWNSWNKFAGQVTDAMVREMADAIVSSGMRDAGYIYVNIDDTWEGAHRDSHGNITTNNKFPDMKKLADYIHSKGLKLGIYSSPGPKTCAGYLGSYQHEEQDAKTYAAWGIDYLKYDWCSAAQVYENNQATMAAAYAKMGLALLRSGRPIVYSLCQYGNLDVGEWGERVGGNLWRTTGDIRDDWQSMSHIGFDLQPGREKYAYPGHWNDPDMLEIGNGHMTDTEYQTHMTLWCILAAPLLAGNDIRSMSPSIAAILMNKELIAVDQDRLGRQGVRVAKDGDLEVWAKPLADGAYAVGLFNRGPAAARVTAKWSDIGISGSHPVRDLWKHEDLGSIAGSYSAEVPSHGVVAIKVAQ